jgi:hypothetical protein
MNSSPVTACHECRRTGHQAERKNDGQATHHTQNSISLKLAQDDRNVLKRAYAWLAGTPAAK